LCRLGDSRSSRALWMVVLSKAAGVDNAGLAKRGLHGTGFAKPTKHQPKSGRSAPSAPLPPLPHMVLQMFLRSLRLPIFLASRALSARPASNMTVREQPFDYFLVLDFEATCSREKPPPHPQEIIEFPVLKVNGRSFQVESTFHQYVQPRVHRELSSFCTELTGIIQDMVDEQPFLEEVLEKFHQWMCSEGLLGSPEKRAAFVTFGDWDLQKMLPSQCSYFKIPMPEYLTSWINLKKAFVEATGHWPKTLPETLEYCRLEQVGRHHSGIVPDNAPKAYILQVDRATLRNCTIRTRTFCWLPRNKKSPSNGSHPIKMRWSKYFTYPSKSLSESGF
ncbi:unnamed protein product, partial [Ixodes persulcatus]